ncbi:hypothetical protein CHS0354_024883 [Potamilus streckersoni]|uniref:Uncharacterized protein n=1 Tax=Potamilus streckersoni TaxID=2493646 RepID=A0AAE0TFM8_9BIVA|nr:hypothetical protein CHS0354_024883 [Potamilus streckersoni]
MSMVTLKACQYNIKITLKACQYSVNGKTEKLSVQRQLILNALRESNDVDKCWDELGYVPGKGCDGLEYVPGKRLDELEYVPGKGCVELDYIPDLTMKTESSIAQFSGRTQKFCLFLPAFFTHQECPAEQIGSYAKENKLKSMRRQRVDVKYFDLGFTITKANIIFPESD